MAKSEESSGEVSATRSPRYPSMNLKEAIEKIRLVYNADKNSGSPIESAIRHMGFKSRSGPANGTLAAMKRFGLADVRDGRLVPTKRAISLLILPPDDDRWKAAVRDAALAPELYASLFERFKATGIPSVQTLEHELILNGGFNANAVRSIVKDFCATLQFAGLTNESGVVLTSGSTEDPLNDEDESMEALLEDERQINKPAVKSGEKQGKPVDPVRSPDEVTIATALSDGNRLEIRLRNKVSPDEFKKVLTKIFGAEPLFVDYSKGCDSPVEE